ncbi:MAG TPA: MBL fold metallo-hydrolase [Thermodesulfobacteriota bacterium]|nr:MBL fold metallo-hydrolase [Thermodesulfobacteriota bacterium]
MRIRKPGKIRDQLWFLGSEESCVYLLEGRDESMFVSGGLSYLVPDILKQFKEFHIDETQIRKLLILHSHFDHVGIVPFFKRRNPELEVYASARGWEILQMPKAIQTVNEFSRSVARRRGKESVYETYDLDWRDGITGISISEGERIDLGDLEVVILETPGHSSCSISAYVPKLKTLFASDAGGIPYRDIIGASGNSNFTEYQRNLEKLKDLDVEYVCADHYGYVAGEEAQSFIRQTVEAAKQERAFMEEAYRKTGDIGVAAKELTANYFNKYPDWVVSPEIVEGVYRQMLRHLTST